MNRLDKTSSLGILAGLAAIIGGFLWEGGHIGGLFEITAVLIVFGGTFAAVAISFPWSRLRKIPDALRLAFRPQVENPAQLIEDMVEYATIARREGVLALETRAADHPNRFLRDGLQMVVDGTDPDLNRQILEVEIDAMEQKLEQQAKIFESAGGYAPTMGIIGTVMGLIHVLGGLADPSTLGPAIAVAFTATLYGVASANILYLPLAAKIRSRIAEQVHVMELMLEGILGIQAGENPNLIRKKLVAFMLMDEADAPVPVKTEESAKENAADKKVTLDAQTR
ncbi:flagellar motor protein [Cohnella faecalis]|uniref:Flagellar motor protein n=1 Tax=Cohnella faecalis TaxID=2315694 RepID=A0A398CH96_9BACL|nr:flagellar motor protein [Cohnella faecalis]RIE02123.1 flagellar motor protein [Cohnella faecalis]